MVEALNVQRRTAFVAPRGGGSGDDLGHRCFLFELQDPRPAPMVGLGVKRVTGTIERTGTTRVLWAPYANVARAHLSVWLETQKRCGANHRALSKRSASHEPGAPLDDKGAQARRQGGASFVATRRICLGSKQRALGSGQKARRPVPKLVLDHLAVPFAPTGGHLRITENNAKKLRSGQPAPPHPGCVRAGNSLHLC